MKQNKVSSLKIDNKDYVVLPKKEYEALLAKAASKTPPAKKLTLNEGKKLAYKLIDKWSKSKKAKREIHFAFQMPGTRMISSKYLASGLVI